MSRECVRSPIRWSILTNVWFRDLRHRLHCLVRHKPQPADPHSGRTWEGTRIELRCPDPSANPYLVLAVCLAAGLDGIQKQIMPPAAVDRNIFNMTEEEIQEEGIDVLPNNLLEAVYEMEKDELVKEVLGTHTSRRYIKAKKKEWAEYSRQVSGWELDQYLYRI